MDPRPPGQAGREGPASAARSEPTGSLADLPLPVRRLVETYGEERVYQIGLDVLGYPVSWCDHPSEFLALVNAVQAGAKGAS